MALLTLAGVLLIAFALAQVFLPATATLPPRIFKQRSIVSGFWATVCINSGNYVFSKQQPQVDHYSAAN